MDHLTRKVCWNTKCPGPNSRTWKEGWRLQSGRVADLCEYCGFVYEHAQFCEVFHMLDTGWRTCNNCKKRIHCGCVVAVASFVHLDYGGVECMSCSKGLAPSKTVENPASETTSITRAKLSDQSSEDEQGVSLEGFAKKQKLENGDAKKTQDGGDEADVAANNNESAAAAAADGSSATMVPLFEKTLTVSDAGRIGRLVLPKACAEAYFPPISSPEGIPIKMSDTKGQEWQFQFRFWPNNNSRMYVLEGVTPCVKAMQLQAGDVVTFSRTDPGGKMVMGYRRNAVPPKLKARAVKESQSATQSRENGAGFAPSFVNKSFGSKTASKTAWEEAQDLLTPPPGVVPSIMTIDGHRFEEYEEPPVLAKRPSSGPALVGAPR